MTMGDGDVTAGANCGCPGAGVSVETPATPPRSRSRSSTTGSRSNQSSRSSSPRAKTWLCDYPGCTKAYSRPSLLEQHLQSHYNYRPHQCTYPGCNDTFFRKDHLERHALKHVTEEEKPFHCSVCGKGVNSRQHLKRHERTHEKSFKCTFEGCDESFYKHQSLKVHLRTIHEIITNGGNTGRNGRHRCEHCEKEFDRPGRLASHIEKHHSEASKLMCDFPDCYKAFRVWSALQLHIKTDHPRLECGICGKKCVGNSGLANHMKVHNEETAIKLWKCTECGTKFQKKEDVVKHYAEQHPMSTLPEELQYNVREEKDSSKGKEKQSLKVVEYYMKKKEEEKKEKKRLREEMELRDKKENETEKSDIAEVTEKSETSLSELGFLVSKPTSSKFKKQQLTRVPSSPDVIDLIVDNVENRHQCPYISCRRLFRKKYDIDRHIAWHEKQNQKLDERVDQILSEYDDANSDAGANSL